MGLELADMSNAEQQSKREKYDEFRNSDELLLSHGFATFFAVTSPWVCAATLGAAMLEIFLGINSLMRNHQRPLPCRARNNEPWSTALDIYGVLAASTNIVLLIFGSHLYDSWTLTEKLVLFVYLEHVLFLARLVMQLMFPGVPRNVDLLQLKQEHMVHCCLENIKVEQSHDLSMFRDSATDVIDIFERDVLENDDEAAEPMLKLWESGRTLLEGLQDESSQWLRAKT